MHVRSYLKAGLSCVAWLTSAPSVAMTIPLVSPGSYFLTYTCRLSSSNPGVAAVSFSIHDGLLCQTSMSHLMPLEYWVMEPCFKITGSQAHGFQNRSPNQSSTKNCALLWLWRTIWGLQWVSKRVLFLSDNNSAVRSGQVDNPAFRHFEGPDHHVSNSISLSFSCSSLLLLHCLPS